jgi:putative NIF3 family GTP cyclohydrolase 1 type 2
MTGNDVQAYLSTFNEQGQLNSEEGFLFGNGDEQVDGICVCWMATTPAVAYAASQGCNLIVCHEALTYWDYPLWKGMVKTTEPWESDRRRLALLEDKGISVLRAHSTVDPTHVGPVLWEVLGLGAPQFSGWVYSHHTVEPITVAQLAQRIRNGLDLTHVRVTGDPLRSVSEVGTCWGGGGLDRNMRLWVEHLFDRGIEALIVGETCDFAQRFAMENDLPLLEAGHSASEDPGLRRLSEDMHRQFPETKVLFRPQEVPWVTL